MARLARTVALFALLAGAPATMADPAAATAVVFSDYSPLATAPEIARRMLSPLVGLQLQQQAAATGKRLVERVIDLAEEKFVLYVPESHSAKGYAVLVFVAPWSVARLPAGWAPALERAGVIFVSADRSGNEAAVFDRRVPLALLAAHNVAQKYPVDPEAVYVAGFSGGGRVALRLALAYPDVFHGAILNAGSDPIGDQRIPLPPQDLFYRFQQASRLVYVTGAGDAERLPLDQFSMRSLRQWCVFDVRDHIERSSGHEVIGSTGFTWALNALLQPAVGEPERLARCRADVEHTLAGELSGIEQRIAHGDRAAAATALSRIDQHYGGLAAPHSVDLERALLAGPP